MGDMLELGKYASRFHYQIGKICALCKIDILLAVGEFAQDLIQGAEEGGLERKNIFTFKNVQDLNRVVENFLEPNDTVLIEGSRKMQMEKIIERLKERLCQK
ncbi:MAG TPA: hypothetical protein EYP78_01980 [Candidatus Omnitrophica bacterium]|nr:hypothetical protein [Candidatus Omnitrophota bacterium]